MILGICGGTGSGKTTVASKDLLQALGPDQALLLAQDAYYKDSSHLPFEERARQNFDHPDAVDFELLIQHVDDTPEPAACPAAVVRFFRACSTHGDKSCRSQGCRDCRGNLDLSEFQVARASSI